MAFVISMKEPYLTALTKRPECPTRRRELRSTFAALQQFPAVLFPIRLYVTHEKPSEESGANADSCNLPEVHTAGGKFCSLSGSQEGEAII